MHSRGSLCFHNKSKAVNSVIWGEFTTNDEAVFTFVSGFEKIF